MPPEAAAAVEGPTRQVEFVEEPYTQIGYDRYPPGDRRTFPEADADNYIAWGWAKCCKTGECGERVEGVQKLQVDSITMPAKVTPK